MLDLQKLVLRRLLDSQDSELYSKITPKYFTGSNLMLYGKIENFYRNNLRLPTPEEFDVVRKDVSLQDYLTAQIMSDDNTNDIIRNEFLIAQLQDFCIRDETINFVDKFLDELEDLEKVEIIDKFQNHLLELNKIIPVSDELINVGMLETIPSTEKFEMYPSGLSPDYDAINGGLGLEELVCLGGRRGSGKSILALNCAVTRFKMGHTVAFFSIEMRYLEVYYRMMSILTEIPFLKFLNNKLTETEKVFAAKTKMKTFYEKTDYANDLIEKLERTGDIQEYEARIKVERPKMKENTFQIIDDASLTLNRIDHYCNMFSNKYPRFTMSVVDYLNIINAEDARDWKTQILFADNLKSLSRKYKLTKFTPYQIDQTMEARFAKGILDAADRAFVFLKAPVDDPDYDILDLRTAKIRNGREINFPVGMNWECVKIDPTRIRKAISDSTDRNNPLPDRSFGQPQHNEGERDLV